MPSIKNTLCAVLLMYLHSSSAIEVKEIAARSASAAVVNLPAHYFTDLNSTRVKVSYGPYDVPGTSQTNGSKGFLDRGATKPCSNCFVTWMQAGLEYENGTYANVNTSLWLHHTFLVNAAHDDNVCGRGPGGERFFASGNERTIVDISMKGRDKTGYYISNNDTMFIYSELRNALPTTQTAVVTIEYEYIPLPLAQGSFRNATPLWFDIGGCGSSELPAGPNNQSSWKYSSPSPWKSTIAGRANWLASHFFDGGVHLETSRNGSVICDARASYGGAGYESPSGKVDVQHKYLSGIAVCEDVGRIEVGDEWSITAYYNTTEYAPLRETNGQLQPVSGIALMYVAEGEEVADSSSSGGGAAATTIAPGAAATEAAGTATGTSAASSSQSATSSAAASFRVTSRTGLLAASLLAGFGLASLLL